jgi:hypothetical protein
MHCELPHRFYCIFGGNQRGDNEEVAKNVAATSSVIANNTASRWPRLLHCCATDPGGARVLTRRDIDARLLLAVVAVIAALRLMMLLKSFDYMVWDRDGQTGRGNCSVKARQSRTAGPLNLRERAIKQKLGIRNRAPKVHRRGNTDTNNPAE